MIVATYLSQDPQQRESREDDMNAILGITFVIALTLFASTVFRDIGLAMVLNPDALMIVCGGTIVAVFLGFPVKRIRSTVHAVIDVFRHQKNREEIAREMLEVARIYRRTDIRGLEKRMRTLKDDYLKLGVSLLINHQSNEDIRNIMEREMMITVMNDNLSQNVLKTIARLTPSFGLAGTVISLVKMFKDMQSIDAIAPLMAVAMMSTFYGVIISNLFMLPLCAKLKEHATLSEALMHITIEGIEAINNREHPLRIEERMKGYCDTAEMSLAGMARTLAVTKSAGSD
jgi:chemotaxis protein MotA